MQGTLEDFSISPTGEHQNYTGGAIITRDDKRCFGGMAIIYKNKQNQWVQKLISTNLIQKFLESMENNKF